MNGNDSEPFVGKSHYFSHIELGKDAQTQIELIAQASRELLASRAIAADKIVVSHGRITDGLDYLSTSIDEVQAGFLGLNSIFEFGISEVVWQIEKNKKSLRNMLKVLMFHLSVPIKERRRRAETYYEHGFIDEAEEDLILSQELNEYDFTAYISLGMIYMFRKIDLDEAIYCFDKAAEYAKVKSTYYASFALMYKARILLEAKSLDNAKQCLEEAINLSPDLQELLYQLSIVEARLSNKEKAISLILKLLEFDIRYCLKVENEPAFNELKPELHEVYKEMIDSESAEIQRQYDNLSLETKRISEQVIRCATLIEDNVSTIEKFELNKTMKRISELVDRKSLLDIYTAAIIVKDEALPLLELLKEDARHYVDKAIEYLKKEKSKAKAKYIQEKSKRFIYTINQGFRSFIIYSSIYGVALFAFGNMAIAIILPTVTFALVWYLNYVRLKKLKALIAGIEEKASEASTIRDAI